MKVIKPVTDWLTPPCEDITYLISKSMDAKLSLRERVQVRIHIMGCILCHRYQEQLQKIERVLKKSAQSVEKEETGGGETLSPESYNRIKSSIHRHLSH
ncbi:MAG TPA: zf-HC2 domain-containing protein [Balneolales bacterium]|nr:zf-HC2 domain-containing protein [Balneolales bacterium]